MVGSQKMNPDIEIERKNCSFNPYEFSVWWNGGEKKLLDKRARGKPKVVKYKQKLN